MNEHQAFEQAWWGDCANTFVEERKQVVYADRMGLQPVEVDGKWPCYDLAGKNVVDLGGGPVSMLLKAVNRGTHCTVVDPCPYPNWVTARYEEVGVKWAHVPAEAFAAYGVSGTEPREDRFDEAWVYNVLQLVDDPAAVITTARRVAPVLRLFEWVEHPASIGHPHVLHVHDLNDWIGNGANGNVEILEEGDLHGIAYSGVFDLAPVPVVA